MTYSVIRKTEEAIKIAHKKLKRHASKKGTELKPETLIYAKYVIVFTTFPENQFTAFDILEWYRIRWQIELVFKPKTQDRILNRGMLGTISTNI